MYDSFIRYVPPASRRRTLTLFLALYALMLWQGTTVACERHTMICTRPNSSLYLSGSVFTVSNRPQFVERVKTDRTVPAPNDQSFDLAVIKFNDNGSYEDPHQNQIKAAADCITEARRCNDNGAVVVVFIHGWHHDANWDIAQDGGDTHFKAFRMILTSLMLREAERHSNPENNKIGRRVVGVYAGWNGDPAGSWFRHNRYLNWRSFFNRYQTAKEIGEHKDIGDAIRTIVARTKDPMELESEPGQHKPESPLILVGHSMGALMLESAFLALLRAKDNLHPLVRKANPRNVVEIRRGTEKELVSFPDVLIALNSAADSQIATDIINELKNQKLEKTLTLSDDHGHIRYSPPLLMSVTSTADSATGFWWKLAHCWRRKTDGHDSSLISHKFVEIKTSNVPCKKKPGLPDFGQNWHCLRKPNPPEKPTPSFAIDLPKRKREGKDDEPDHDRYQLDPLGDVDCARLAWVFQVPPEIIANHNDIFSFRSSPLIMGLIQISGAVMSLAEDLKGVFEEEDP